MAVKVQLNRRGVRELLRSPGVSADLRKRGEAIARAAGPGHEVDTFRGRSRARATVRTATVEAMLNEQHHKTLTNAVRVGR